MKLYNSRRGHYFSVRPEIHSWSVSWPHVTVTIIAEPLIVCSGSGASDQVLYPVSLRGVLAVTMRLLGQDKRHDKRTSHQWKWHHTYRTAELFNHEMMRHTEWRFSFKLDGSRSWLWLSTMAPMALTWTFPIPSWLSRNRLFQSHHGFKNVIITLIY